MTLHSMAAQHGRRRRVHKWLQGSNSGHLLQAGSQMRALDPKARPSQVTACRHQPTGQHASISRPECRHKPTGQHAGISRPACRHQPTGQLAGTSQPVSLQASAKRTACRHQPTRMQAPADQTACRHQPTGQPTGISRPDSMQASTDQNAGISRPECRHQPTRTQGWGWQMNDIKSDRLMVAEIYRGTACAFHVPYTHCNGALAIYSSICAFT